MISFTVRFLDEIVYKLLTESAKKNKRSINSEILYAIEYYLKHTKE